MKLLDVFAPHEPKSFGAALHARAFNPIATATDFGTDGKFKSGIASKTAGQIR